MKFAEKLRRLTAGRRRAEIARAAGVAPSVLNNYINRGSEPMASAGLKLARGLNVPIGWLLDDEADWPPPDADAARSPGLFSDRELMLEVARRQRLATLRVLDALASAEKIDWAAVESGAAGLSAVDIAAVTAPIFYFIQLLSLFDPANAARQNHLIMPGSERPLAHFGLDKIVERVAKLQQNPSFNRATAGVLALIPQSTMREIDRHLEWAGALSAVHEPPAIFEKASPPAARQPLKDVLVKLEDLPAVLPPTPAEMAAFKADQAARKNAAAERDRLAALHAARKRAKSSDPPPRR